MEDVAVDQIDSFKEPQHSDSKRKAEEPGGRDIPKRVKLGV